jgi:hypothetical protein
MGNKAGMYKKTGKLKKCDESEHGSAGMMKAPSLRQAVWSAGGTTISTG